MKRLMRFWMIALVSGTAAMSMLASVAAATPVNLVVAMNASEGGFGFSYLHTADLNPTTVAGINFFQSGTLQSLTGTLTGDLVGNALSGISGTILVSGGPDIVVTNGFVNFDASAPDTFGGNLVTSTHGTFSFLDHTFAGVANSLTGSNLRLWGNNWNNTGTPNPGSNPRWGLDLGISIVPVPEPGTALLMGLGLAALGVRRGLR